jgi:hypothetical protein
MNILCLLLAQVLTGSAFTQPVPYGYRTDFTIDMPARDPLLDYHSRIVESGQIGDAVATGQVYDPFSGRTMIRTTAPASPYYNMTREQASKIRDIETGQLAQEVNIRGAELKQKQDALEYKYKLNEIDQSEKIYDEISALDPRSPDYLTTRSSLFNKYPIAAQNPRVQNSIGLIDRTHSAITENNDVINRNTLAREAAEAAALRKQEISQGRTIVSKYGPGALVAFEDELSKDDNTSPIAVAARLEDASQRLSMLSQLNELEIGPEHYYTADDRGQPVFDKMKAESILKRMPTASQAPQAAINKQKIRENNVGKYEEWSPDVKADYDLFDEQVQRYKSLTGQKKQEATPKKKSIDDFF